MTHKHGAVAPRTADPVPLNAKMLTEDGEFEGYASTFGNIDQGNDRVMAGAFAESLRRRPIERIKMLYQHDPEKIIGRWLEAREDGNGLHVKGKLFTNMARGREVYELMKEGVLDGLSIGFRTMADAWNSDEKVRELNELDLREISVVTFPMNESASVMLVKEDRLPTEREFERHLRDAGFSRSQAKAIVSSGFRSLTERDAGTGDDGLLEAIRQARQGLGT